MNQRNFELKPFNTIKKKANDIFAESQKVYQKNNWECIRSYCLVLITTDTYFSFNV